MLNRTGKWAPQAPIQVPGVFKRARLKSERLPRVYTQNPRGGAGLFCTTDTKKIILDQKKNNKHHPKACTNTFIYCMINKKEFT
jgi:hypothetical protein